ncbi:MAG TPA: PilT/PilU family type 4a pilus ATPase [Tepidisphaeraceae bacterium]|jgi:twitching motility protein PilT|nr:PilT/PilU family type 4a pilus ATPase [Tepidisphaeraceae bacterium]
MALQPSPSGAIGSAPVGAAVAAPPIEPDIQQPQIHIEERHLSLLDFLRQCIKLGGSDVHLQAGSVPMIRVDGRPRYLAVPEITDQQMTEYTNEVFRDPNKRAIFDKRGAVDLAYAMPDKSARFRTNVFHSRERFALVMRRIVTKIPNFDELNLPPQIEKLADHHRGLVVVSGTTGSGKTTTLAALFGKINRTRGERLITVEDPVEYQHDNLKSMVSQIEVGTDSESYEYALREMMRQDPDTILIGEIRDSFSLSTGLRAADTGHLVFTSIHATNAPMTIERMVSLFDPDQKMLQQAQLGMNLIAVMSQRLAKRRDGVGRVPVVEIMMATPLVRKYILEGEFEKLKGAVGNRESGSQSFDQHLTELFQKQIIDVTEAKRLASNIDALNLALRGITNSDTRLK